MGSSEVGGVEVMGVKNGFRNFKAIIYLCVSIHKVPIRITYVI